MRCLTLISSIITFTLLLSVSQTTCGADANDINKSNEATNTSMRHGRQFQLESHFFGNQPRVHIIKIPSRVSKVKLIGPYTEPFSNSFLQLRRSSHARQGPNTKSPTFEDQDDYNKDLINLNSKKVKKNLKKQRVKELGLEDYYGQENLSYDQNIFGEQPVRDKRFHSAKKSLKNKKKLFSEDYNSQMKYDESDTSMKYNTEDYKTPNVYKSEEDSEEYYDFESAATTNYGQRHSPPMLQKIKTTTPVKMMKPNYFKEKPALTKYGHDYFVGTEFKNQQSKRDPFFNQQYTTHNRYVMTNFGLPNTNNIQQHSLPTPTMDYYEKLGQQIMAGSEQVLNTIPVSNPGIKVIQPPQFRDISFGRPIHHTRSTGSTQQNAETTPSQKATIRDILEQDCPSYEAIGFCESPPRYPMYQIKNIIKRCAIILEAMNTQNFEDQKTVLGFSKRSGFAVDAENGTTALDGAEAERLISQKKISSDDGAACHSDVSLTEPGYAREVISGKWFVVVQDPDVLQQKIVTDTCTNSGKPCGGLANLNCSILSGNAFKSTRCVQRFSYQKLITWDPDSPESCPKMRVFKFPSACVCHLGPF